MSGSVPPVIVAEGGLLRIGLSFIHRQIVLSEFSCRLKDSNLFGSAGGVWQDQRAIAASTFALNRHQNRGVADGCDRWSMRLVIQLMAGAGWT